MNNISENQVLQSKPNTKFFAVLLLGLCWLVTHPGITFIGLYLLISN